MESDPPPIQTLANTTDTIGLLEAMLKDLEGFVQYVAARKVNPVIMYDRIQDLYERADWLVRLMKKHEKGYGPNEGLKDLLERYVSVTEDLLIFDRERNDLPVFLQSSKHYSIARKHYLDLRDLTLGLDRVSLNSGLSLLSIKGTVDAWYAARRGSSHSPAPS